MLTATSMDFGSVSSKALYSYRFEKVGTAVSAFFNLGAAEPLTLITCYP